MSTVTNPVIPRTKTCQHHGTVGGDKAYCHHPANERNGKAPFLKHSICESCELFQLREEINDFREPEPVSLKCQHLGEVSHQVQCKSCSGVKLFPVHECSEYSHCATTEGDWNNLRANDVRVKPCHKCKQNRPSELDKLAIIATHFNPCGYERPRDNYHRWLASASRYQEQVTTAEISYDGRFLSEGVNVHGTQMNVAFQKEALINKAVSELPEDIEYVCWVDADLEFSNPDWALEGIAKLATGAFSAVQLFEHVVHENKEGIAEREQVGLAWNYLHTRKPHGMPGGAWMMRRSDFDAIGGLYPFKAVGGGDVTFWNGVAGHFIKRHKQQSGAADVAENAWIENAHKTIPQRVSSVRGKVRHLWHGDAKNRQHQTRQRILKEFDPGKDIFLNADGILEWTSGAMAGRVLEFFEGRKEDG